jgi:hypothetical protein
MAFMKSDLLWLVVANILSFSQITTAQDLRDLARDQARRNPGVPLEQPAPPGDYRPKTIEELTKEADLVVLAKLSRLRSYLSASADRVLTDYSIVESRVIAGQLPVLTTQKPGTELPLTLTVFGGEINVDGVVVRGTDNNRDAISDSGQYVLFLRKSRQPGAGRYEIYYGGIFEVLHDKVKPLLKRAAVVFGGTIDASPEEFISRVEASSVQRR